MIKAHRQLLVVIVFLNFLKIKKKWAPLLESKQTENRKGTAGKSLKVGIV